MRHPQIVVFESDGTLARMLEPITRKELRWILREPRQAPAAIELLRSNSPAVLVLKVGRNLVRELTFLDEIHSELSDVPIVVVNDAEDVTLMSIALELGATFVVQPPQSRQILGKVVESLMTRTIQRLVSDSTEPQLKSFSEATLADGE